MKRFVKLIIGMVFYHTRLCLFLFKLISPKLLVVFTFHRVTDHRTNLRGYLRYEKGVDVRVFKKQVEFITRHFNVINMDQYKSHVSGRSRPGLHEALITFDDGDDEFETYILPVLKNHNCPAVIFVPTAYPDSNLKFWHVRVSNLFACATEETWKSLKQKENSLPPDIQDINDTISVKTAQEKASGCRKIVRFLDSQPVEYTDSVIETMERVIGFEDKLNIGTLGWNELIRLKEQGIEIESHTVKHRKLTLLDKDAILEELEKSKAHLKQKLAIDSEAICYPSGAFDDTVLNLSEKAGYKVGFTTQPGISGYPLNGRERFRIKRLGVNGTNKYELELYLAKLLAKNLLKQFQNH